MSEGKMKYFYVIRFKEEDSENGFSYVKMKTAEGICLTTQMPFQAKLFKTKNEAEKQMNERNEQKYSEVKRIKI
jgi:hypothetical protein